MKAYMARRRETTDKRILKEETLRRTYNLSMERYEEILANQGGVCGICGSTESGQTEWFEVDHDHACCDRKGSCGLCVRGLLCTGCNSGLSRFRDDPALLRSAADYLENRA
jgi:hypothetical protein